MNFPWGKNKKTGPLNEEKLPLFSLKGKLIDLSYTGADISSDGGLLLLRELENQIGLVKALAGCIEDERDERYVQHSTQSLLSCSGAPR